MLCGTQSSLVWDQMIGVIVWIIIKNEIGVGSDHKCSAAILTWNFLFIKCINPFILSHRLSFYLFINVYQQLLHRCMHNIYNGMGVEVDAQLFRDETQLV